MESSHGRLLVALIATLVIILPVQAQDQEGFISLDCGLSPNEVSPYSEEETGLQYSSDSDFIDFGKISRIHPSIDKNYLKPDTTVRYFPDGIRNCYHLRVKERTNYLIRARFIYGNYDGLNINPKFDLYIGPNFWTTLDFELYAIGTWKEIFHIPRLNSLDLCLVKTGTSTPFISVLEIRPLPNNSYITTSGSLKTLLRYHLSNSRSYTRYPKDAYDRIWDKYLDTNWRQISTTLSVDNSDSFRLPEDVLKTAALPFDAREPLTNSEVPVSTFDEVFIYLHFAEVQVLRANESREFDISLNGESITDSYSPLYLQSDTVHNLSPVTCKDGSCIIKLSQSRNSTHPPLLNAVEIFTIAEFPQSETDESEVVAIKNIKASYGLSRLSWQGDPCVPRQFSWDGLICSDTNKSIPPRITHLNLSSSGLRGTIADEIQNLTHLEKLDLSNNKLTGVVPEFLANMKSLLLIDLSKNNLKGSIPKALQNREKKGLMLIVDGDQIPCLPGSCEKKKFPVMIVALISSAVLFIAVLLVLFFVLRKKDGSSHVQATPQEHLKSGTSIKTKRRRFTYAEVRQMTNNFQRDLGEGGFGMVYHGIINSSQEVAVKLLSQTSAQGYKEFKAEVELLLRVHHINLVSLVGYCEEREHLALIYEYMPNGDLQHHLLGKHDGSVLSWTTRLRIAVDAALGLEYLHIGCRPSMVHRDVKSNNILLDEQFMAKIADFGLSRSLQLGDESKAFTVVAGTPGYLDPEYYRTSCLAEMSDVYSFGIVLLEIITNQRVIDQTRKKSHITEWTAFMLNRGDITRIMDPNLHGDYNSRSVWRTLELAMMCANHSSDKRPTMSQVVIELKECLRSEISMTGKKQDNDSHASFKMRMSVDTKDAPRARYLPHSSLLLPEIRANNEIGHRSNNWIASELERHNHGSIEQVLLNGMSGLVG